MKFIYSFLVIILSMVLFLTGVTDLAMAIDLPGSSQTGSDQKKVEEKSIEDVAVRELLKTIEEQTEIATKTKMNIDFVPGMVSVLHGKDLIARGARTVYEALEFIPGIDLLILNTGTKLFHVRGNFQAKLMLNGISLNPTGSANFSTVLNIPIEQVDRIEVIRGPGSAIYGEFGFSGVVNVVTREDPNTLFARGGSFTSLTTGGIFSYQKSESEFKVSLNASGMRSEGGDVRARRDALYLIGQGDISNAPGPTNEKEENAFVFFKLNYKGFSFMGQYLRSSYGDHFGIFDALPPNQKRIVNDEQNLSLETRQRFQIADDFLFNAKLGFSDFNVKIRQAMVYPPGFVSTDPSTGLPIVHPDGMIYSPYYKERKLYGGFDLNYKGVKQHELLIGMEFTYVKELEAWLEANFDPQTFYPVSGLRKFTGGKNFIAEGLRREITSIYLQDQYSITPRLMMTAGLRFDYYSDVGGNLSPRLALCYNLTDKHIIKFQYAEAFRPPTFLEMYFMNNPLGKGNPDMKAAVARTLEIAHIYNSGSTIFRSTLFYSFLNNYFFDDPWELIKATSRGCEFEFLKKLSQFAKLDMNLSYVDVRNRDTDKELRDIVNWMGDVGLIIQPLPNYSFAIQYRYVGKRSREPNDFRIRLDSYHTVDLTGNIFNLGLKGLTLRGGVKNLFNIDIKYPDILKGYLDDYPRPGRQWWLALSYEF